MPPETPPTPFVDSVLHPTDFSPGGETAFAHALAIAVLRQARLTLLHVGSAARETDAPNHFPRVRETLERWKVVEVGASREDVVDKLGIGVTKVGLRGGSPLRAALEYLDEHPAELLVLATEGREGLARWLRPSVAEKLARGSKAMTLFVPKEGRGFVSPETGETRLARVLVPIDHDPHPLAAMTYAARAALALGDSEVEIGLLHVGDEPPQVAPPEVAGITWQSFQRQGDAVEAIASCAEEFRADLVAMATRGHDGVLDALRGSITEQVLRRTACPVLAVPAP